MIQLDGRILLVCQRAEACPGRHVSIVYASDDQGVTWQASAPIDLADQGNYAVPSQGCAARRTGVRWKAQFTSGRVVNCVSFYEFHMGTFSNCNPATV
jgi:hypothetical protein